MACISQGMHLVGLHLTGLHLTGLHLTGLYLTGLHLTGLHLTGLSLKLTSAHTSFVAASSGTILLVLLLTLRDLPPVIGYGDGRF